jgi:hypothetical protein
MNGTTDRTICWAPWSGPGMEKLRLRRGHPGDAAYVATAVVLGMRDGAPFRLSYKLKFEANWQTRKAMFDVSTAAGVATKMLRTDGIGHWRDESGAMLDELDGCLDVDISATPFTNLLPIRRLKQKAGQQHDITAVYVDVPSLRISAMQQRYTCLDPLKPGEGAAVSGRYLYEGPLGRFRAELPVDADGMVLDYDGQFRRVYPL